MSAAVDCIRSKLAARRLVCEPTCPGWAVFNAADTGPVLQACDECFFECENPVTDEEVDLLPEAQHELALAVEDGDAYAPPEIGPPCACGCVVQRRTGDHGHMLCSGCGATLPPLTAPAASVADLVDAVFAAARQVSPLRWSLPHRPWCKWPALEAALRAYDERK